MIKEKEFSEAAHVHNWKLEAIKSKTNELVQYEK